MTFISEVSIEIFFYVHHQAHIYTHMNRENCERKINKNNESKLDRAMF